MKNILCEPKRTKSSNDIMLHKQFTKRVINYELINQTLKLLTDDNYLIKQFNMIDIHKITLFLGTKVKTFEDQVTLDPNYSL